MIFSGTSRKFLSFSRPVRRSSSNYHNPIQQPRKQLGSPSDEDLCEIGACRSPFGRPRTASQRRDEWRIARSNQPRTSDRAKRDLEVPGSPCSLLHRLRVDLGPGGDPITPHTIRVDLPHPYSHVGTLPVQLRHHPKTKLRKLMSETSKLAGRGKSGCRKIWSGSSWPVLMRGESRRKTEVSLGSAR